VRPVIPESGNCRKFRGDIIMKGLKGVIVVATVIATAAAVSACRKEVAEPSLKLGAADVAVHVVR
jgi:hypothetical protein